MRLMMAPLQPFHSAAALAVLKSKPQHLSIQDYVHALRRCIKTRCEEDRLHHEIDHSAFWQEQCESAQDALERERNKTFRLGQRNEELETQVAELQAQVQSGKQKRKAVNRNNRNTDTKPASDPSTMAELSSTATLDPAVKAMRHIHRARSLCKGNMYGTEASELAYHLIQGMQALTQIVEELSSSRPLQEEIETTVVALARSCISIFHGLKRLDTLVGKEQFPSHVVHACVKFFDGLFTSIEEAALGEAKLKRALSHNRKKGPLPALGNLAASLISNLQKSVLDCCPHEEILEGATYYLLDRLGEATHELLLEGPRDRCIETEIGNLPLPEDKQLDPKRQLAVRAMLISAPHLVKILKRAVANNTSKGPLASFARTRLQGTLVKFIFGDESEDESNDVLRLPDVLDEGPVHMETDGSENVEQGKCWFESQLWAVVGWEMLGIGADL